MIQTKRQILWAALAMGAVVFASGCATRTVYVVDSDRDSRPPPQSQFQGDAPVINDVASVDEFRQPLAAYGNWIVHPSYGSVWIPAQTAVSPGWRPYTNGNWEYTEYGWTFVSNEPFGWATAHYGRWYYDSIHGWVWVPGRRWGPAWVSWRTGGGYVGWAPLPPGAYYGSSYVVYETSWVFVSTGSFGTTVVTSVWIRGPRYRDCYRATRPYRDTYVVNDRTVYRGPNPDRIREDGGRVVRRPVREVDNDRPTSRPPRGVVVERTDRRDGGDHGAGDGDRRVGDRTPRDNRTPRGDRPDGSRDARTGRPVTDDNGRPLRPGAGPSDNALGRQDRTTRDARTPDRPTRGRDRNSNSNSNDDDTMRARPDPVRPGAGPSQNARDRMNNDANRGRSGGARDPNPVVRQERDSDLINEVDRSDRGRSDRGRRNPDRPSVGRGERTPPRDTNDGTPSLGGNDATEGSQRSGIPYTPGVDRPREPENRAPPTNAYGTFPSNPPVNRAPASTGPTRRSPATNPYTPPSSRPSNVRSTPSTRSYGAPSRTRTPPARAPSNRSYRPPSPRAPAATAPSTRSPTRAKPSKASSKTRKTKKASKPKKRSRSRESRSKKD